MNSFLKGVGNGIASASKAVLNTAEKAVEVTGVGKMAEAAGFHVDANIHDNGFNAQLTGPAAVAASGGRSDRIEGGIKLKSTGGDFGGKGKGEAFKNGVSVARCEADLDGRGFAASAAVGLAASSGFRKIRTEADMADLVAGTISSITK